MTAFILGNINRKDNSCIRNCLLMSIPHDFIFDFMLKNRVKIQTTVHSSRVHYGGGDKTVPKSLEGCSMEICYHIW